ncbi:FadR family transcriptional regulator [Halalkalibacillus sediminis]|uniref:FadR family transcriptional regulator n=1 Tax=Halalkalibacillus sediminis TaxID=2018042 RepID=A0A2I0QY69_9BACI|nr:GntR family transcriptional regulator [Halalkalibacillus sediminis]PKR79273.1 FadR family transcriptional regulator [Halalkalibacillus sediminis]
MTNQSKMKVYQEVLEQIRIFIEENELSEGDRLPSERELAEQLNAGRSSVREALRAIELLGLIETKHGEGTFLKTYRPYHSVELLATFVLRESNTKSELVEVKSMLEQQGILKTAGVLTSSDLDSMVHDLKECDSQPEYLHTCFFMNIFEKTENRLLLKIWHLVDGFFQTKFDVDKNPHFYKEMIELLRHGETVQAMEKVEHLYER